ncbi:MAG: acyl-ACP--UDP-N-acetylglucosamine O-acyltransferase [Synergistaceae bacterium]|nr:acyl-ACP--UDP-N-acetylglucosamine O-acyltransferase [Synergistaceae bacterium]
MSTRIHPTAVISERAQIGDNVDIGPYAIVEGNAQIGDGTVIKSFAKVCENTILGPNCTLHEHSVIGGAPQDLSFKGEETWAKVGSDVVFREYVTVNRATGEGEATVVGDRCFIMEGVHLAHNVKLGTDCIISNKSGLSGHVHLGDFVVIGGMSGFHQFVHIGSYCMVGGFSRITQDIPPYCLAAGVPCRVYDINKVGLRRRGFDSKSRLRIHDMYKIIYGSDGGVRAGVAEMFDAYRDDPYAKAILEFAEEATRGLTPRISRDKSSQIKDQAID